MTQTAKMTERIKEELRRLEQEEQVRIVYACESGSRAWGFPSQDSDYDVRFLYVRPLAWYTTIFDRRDVIERPIDDQLDISGWDIRKALQLFRKSNPPLLEWLQSPVCYKEEGTAAQRVRELADTWFSPRACMYHYLHMAQGNYRDYLKRDLVQVKKYFYVLRPLLACRWIAQYKTMPPMAFDTLVEHGLTACEQEVRTVIGTLLVRKRAGEEWNREPRIDVLNRFIEQELLAIEAQAPHMRVAAARHDDELDALFRAIVMDGWVKNAASADG